jgi:very-short-patch-repair endonuclease
MAWYSHPRQWDRLKDGTRERRSKPTPAEAMLWKALRDKRLSGVNFRREHPIGGFAVDFYCPDANLIIEVDGPIHYFQQDRDAARQSYLEAGNFRVMRFRNEQVLKQLDSVLAAIKAALAAENH